MSNNSAGSAKARKSEKYFRVMNFSNPSKFRCEKQHVGFDKKVISTSKNFRQHSPNRDHFEEMPPLDLCDLCSDMSDFGCGRHNQDIRKTDQAQIVIELQSACKITISVSQSTHIKIESPTQEYHSGKSR